MRYLRLDEDRLLQGGLISAISVSRPIGTALSIIGETRSVARPYCGFGGDGRRRRPIDRREAREVIRRRASRQPLRNPLADRTCGGSRVRANVIPWNAL